MEIFCCSGGMAEGFRRACIVFDWVFDRDTDACDSYKANHGHRPIQMDARDLLRVVQSGWRPALDLMVCDPPCTPWSRAGKRLGTADERDMLATTCALIEILKPRAYLIGNVPGLDDENNWPTVQRTIGALSKHGYCCADYFKLDAADYGVPQHRIRPFWFGHLSGPCLRVPAPSHGDPATIGHSVLGDARAPWVTCREALGHLEGAELGRKVRLKWKDETDHRPCDPDEPARTMTGHGHCDGATIALNSKHPPSSLETPAHTIATRDRCHGGTVLELEPPRPIEKGKRPPSTQGPQRERTYDPNQPGPTVLTDTDRIGASSVKLDWPWDQRANASDKGPNAVILSERAAAILQGFPDGECSDRSHALAWPGHTCITCGRIRRWTFSGKTKQSRFSQLGQAMPPALAEAVAREIVKQMAASDRAEGAA